MQGTAGKEAGKDISTMGPSRGLGGQVSHFHTTADKARSQYSAALGNVALTAGTSSSSLPLPTLGASPDVLLQNLLEIIPMKL